MSLAKELLNAIPELTEASKEELEARRIALEKLGEAIDEEAADELNRINVFLGYGGKWHPKEAEHKGTTDARHDFDEWGEHPCCGAVTFDGYPYQWHQVSAKGCQAVPAD